MRMDTLAVHAGYEPDGTSGAVAQPITLSVNFEHGDSGVHEGCITTAARGIPTATPWKRWRPRRL
jgi:O-acetylhomoserine/O-acetylserine sulfhydrylase-like pyridoxal-dependent enzyme